MMMPDVNVLVALASASHASHTAARDWLRNNTPVATCTITELGMLRVLIQTGVPVAMAEAHLENFVLVHRGKLVACDLAVGDLKGKIRGHKQLTDLYLLELCRKHGLDFATFDQSIPGAVIVR